ncbi:MAG: hypothetical protein RL033_2943 [Pseudomonadota bacterium]
MEVSVPSEARRPTPSASVLGWCALAALVGALLPTAATLLDLLRQSRPFSLQEVWRVQHAEPLHWIIDAAPALLSLGVGVALHWSARLIARENEARGALTRRLEGLLQEQRAARERTDFLMKALHHGVVLSDQSLRVLEWSPGAEEILGYSAADMRGRPLTDLADPADRARWDEALQDSAAAAGGTSWVLRGRKSNQLGIHLELSLVRWSTADGTVLGAVLRDITRQVLAEQRLREVEFNWRILAQNTSDVLLLLDRAGTILFANRGFAGQLPEDLLGADAAHLLQPELASELNRALEQVFGGGVPCAFENHQAADGASGLWCRLTPQTEDGDVVRAVLCITDTTERRARDAAQRHLAAIVSTTRDAVLSTDTDGRIRTWNRGAELLFGYTEPEVVGKSVTLLSRAGDRDAQREMIQRLRQGEALESCDVVRLTKTGKPLRVLLALSALRDEAGRFKGASGVLHDLTHLESLQDSLLEAKQAAESASRMKSQFLANMSHEVRTPLNGVVGAADLLRQTPLSATQASYVATLLDATQRLRMIVDDILDFSKIEAGKLTLESVDFDLKSMLEGSVELFRHAARQQGTELILQLPVQPLPRVVGDPHRLRQVIDNLLSNATKFTTDGEVCVSLQVVEDAASALRARIEVRDTGLGISAEAQSTVFLPFTQADTSTTRRFGGTGLGLPISRQLTQLMGGSLTLQSQLGSGSTFRVEVALVKSGSSARRPAQRPSLPAPAPGAGWRVLVAEDNVINQTIVVAMLEGLGCHVELAKNGRAAVERWHAGGHDAILMDCQMPEMSGFEATLEIRRLEGERHIPIIAMTAQAYPEDRERCLLSGMDDYLAKPVTRKALRATLSRWLELGSMVPELQLEPTPRAPAIDVAALQQLEEQLGDGGRELLEQLVSNFADDVARVCVRMTELLSRGDGEALAFEAHRLQSAAAYLAAGDLARDCKALERAARAGELGSARQLLAGLAREYDGAQRALEAYVRTPRPLAAAK